MGQQKVARLRELDRFTGESFGVVERLPAGEDLRAYRAPQVWEWMSFGRAARSHSSVSRSASS